MDDEIWLSIPGYEGEYEVSNIGRVRSLDRVVVRPNGVPLAVKGQMMTVTTQASSTDYYAVGLRRGGKRKNHNVHVLVAEAFHGPRPKGMVACHGTLGKHVNTPENIRWDTQRNNLLDQVREGTHHNAIKTQCYKGHEFSKENTYINPTSGGRQCKTCLRIKNREYRRKVRRNARELYLQTGR